GVWGAAFSQPPTSAQQKIMQNLAHQAGCLLDNAHQIAALQAENERYADQVEELEFIRQADRELTSELDPERVVQFMLDWAQRRTAADAAVLWLLNTDQLIISQTLGLKYADI